MDMISSCLGAGRHRRSAEQEPLLPRYDDETSLQRRVHQKLHTYQMLRALSKGFMPSNEQAIVCLRTLLAADVLNPDNTQLSDSGQALVHYTKQWIRQLIELLQHKNANDQIQDFIWYLSKARVSVDMEHIAERATKARAKADTAAVYSSLQTLGSLLLTNSDFRLFLGDLNVVAREVFRDTAFALSEASKEAGKRIEPSAQEQESVKQPGNGSHSPPSQQDLTDQTIEVSKILSATASTVVDEAESSVLQKFEGPEKETMIHRLKDVVLNLRRRRDYSDSVSTLSLLLKRYAMVYSRIARDTLQAAEEEVDANPETDRALTNFWLFLSSFGEAREWEELEKRAETVMEHGREDPNFEELVGKLGDALQEMFTDPDFFDHAEQRFQELRAKSKQLSSGSSLRDDIEALLSQLQSTFYSVLRDKDISHLVHTSRTILKILSPRGYYTNTDLMADAINVFVPLLVQSVNYVPIPRLEVSTPQVDLLLENLILEPGVTVNHTSFFPYRLRVETLNDVEIRKAKFRTTSAVKTLVRIRIDGISIKGEEIGFWLRAHSSLLRLADEGIASFELDERGMDVQLDVEVGRDRMEKILTLRGVRVRIHKLNFKLRRSKFSFLSWLFKPLLRPIIRKTMEMKMAAVIGDALHFANRELLYARERLRATRIADPDDLKTFFKAVLARLTPPDDPDLYARVGVGQPGRGVFENVYAPGSIVKLWRDEAEQAPQRIRENERDGWRNSIFDVHATMMT
ncbi:bactericidal permeability-increasing protein [Parathielavia appendiculata]|uniref:Bactericidal permeability-increasing protein n=1 Tax=Parathielavia appendiculata TaxID=2587402 RepID=A0AAN6Z1Z0_9PEZI|nr:bactericidal permeability-increasing protein [Parathielavia appendiculata]